MPTIKELIEDYQEGDFLDFKKEEYGKAKKHELVKDVLAFANSEHIGDKYIIIGLKKNGEGIEFSDVKLPEDSANIQSIIHDNIKPDLNIDYVPYQYKGYKLVVLRIVNPIDKPYSTKKVVTNPSGGTALVENSFKIRKGSRIKDISREDLDKIYINKVEQKPNLDDKIKIKFRQNDGDEIQLKSIGEYQLPSDTESDRLQDLINKAEIDFVQDKLSGKRKAYSITQRMLSPMQRLEHLKLKQQIAKDSFRDQDAYYLYEELAHKLQFIIYNNGNFTLQKATILIEIEPYKGLQISDKVYSPSGELSDAWYPFVKKLNNGGYAITANASEIKHKLPHELLRRPLRVFFADNLKGTNINLKITLHAENYHDVLIFKKHIEVI
jgi:hypothetical protein